MPSKQENTEKSKAMREVNEEQYLKACKKADYLYLHRLVLLAMNEGVEEGDTIHNFYHRIIFDLVETIYKQEAANPSPDFTGIKWIAARDGRTYSAFCKDDPIYGAFAETTQKK